MVTALFWLAGEIIHLLIYAIIIAAILNMCVGFGIANPRNPIVAQVMDFLNRLTEPMLRPIRRVLPYFGNIDISPLVAILLLQALQMVLADIYAHLVMAGLAI